MIHRLETAIFTIPDLNDWLQAALIILIYTFMALPVGFRWGFLKVDIQSRWVTGVGIMILTFLSPAITEELFFRVLLLPHITEKSPVVLLWLWGIGSLGLFVVYHPLNALTFFPSGAPTFFHLVFLLLAAILGGICTIADQQSGSLWPPVAIHWWVVAMGLLVFSGYRKSYDESGRNPR